MTTKTFKRYELKFTVTTEQYEAICAELTKYMSYDPYCQNNGSYMIYNIYFDTWDDSVIRHSLSKPYYKEKLRLRSYKMPTEENDTVFLELKKKIGGIVSKRRTVLSYDEAMSFIKTKTPPLTSGYQDTQVVTEISDFLTRYEVTPKVYISYERVAYFDKNDSEFRVSFDKDILTRRDHVTLRDGDSGAELMPNGGYLMEVKCAGAMPLWMTSLLSDLKVYTTGFSKYGTAYKAYARSLSHLLYTRNAS